MELTDIQQRFVIHWGEMGSAWGVNRTVAQIHALLFIHGRPLHAEELAATLGVARSNVSNSLKELQNWGLVRVTHTLGDRRDYFETSGDVWELFRTIVRGRKEREFDPTTRLLAELAARPPAALLLACHASASPDRGAARFLRESARHAPRAALWLVPADEAAQAGHAARWQNWLRAEKPGAALLASKADALAWLQKP